MGDTHQGKRSPLKRKPPRNPGESLQEARQRLIEDEWIPYVFLATTMVLFAVFEWVRSLTHTPPQPITMSLVALAAVAYCTFKFFTMRERNRTLRLGEQGEKEVGHSLEKLCSQGSAIFHDVVGTDFNIDHVVVSPHGIFVIETKTYSKPVRGRAEVVFDGERILVNGIEPERDAIRQVRSLAGWLRDLLSESTGRRFPIKGAVVFPGWFTTMRSKNESDVWVLNPGMLPAYIEREPIVLKPEDVALVSSRIRIHMQTVE